MSDNEPKNESSPENTLKSFAGAMLGIMGIGALLSVAGGMGETLAGFSAGAPNATPGLTVPAPNALAAPTTPTMRA